jgi:hypothetical protein
VEINKMNRKINYEMRREKYKNIYVNAGCYDDIIVCHRTLSARARANIRIQIINIKRTKKEKKTLIKYIL